MKILGFNGSPRKEGNSSQLLDSALNGAKGQGAEIERVELYDLHYTGCRSCNACKRKSSFYGKGCAVQDDITSLLTKALQADAWIFATPIYMGHMSSGLAAFLERLHFPYKNYDEKTHVEYLLKNIPSIFIYSMNASQEVMHNLGIESSCQFDKYLMEMVFGPVEYMTANFTMQFDDYSKYHAAGINVAAKHSHREVQFPRDLAKAYELGKRLVMD